VDPFNPDDFAPDALGPAGLPLNQPLRPRPQPQPGAAGSGTDAGDVVGGGPGIIEDVTDGGGLLGDLFSGTVDVVSGAVEVAGSVASGAIDVAGTVVSAGADVVGVVASGAGEVAGVVGGVAEGVGGVIEGAGSAADGCASCSVAFLVLVLTAATAVAAILR
jgi:hypothetical protein